MRVGIFGSKDWSNYPDVMRALTIFIQEVHELNHDHISFVHSGSKGAENMITEYIGKTQKFLKEKKFKIKEEIARAESQIAKDIGIMESGLDFALIFSTGCKRTKSCERALKEFNVAYKLIENA
jgi:hypothetical protein